MTATSHDQHHDAPVVVPPIDVAPLRPIAFGAAAVGLGAFAVLGGIHASAHEHGGVRDLFLTYLCGWVFWACLPFGSLGLLMIGYLTSASWGVVFRRSMQASTRTLPFIALLAAPIFVSLFVMEGEESPYWWAGHGWHEAQVPTDATKKAEYEASLAKLKARGWDDEIATVAAAKETPPEAVEEVHHKQHGYANAPILTGLNPTSFMIRFAVIISVFGVLIHFLNKWGAKNETTDDKDAYANLRAVSGPGMVTWAILLTILLTDFVMSVEPTWASSMFPIVFGMNSFVCTFSVCIFTIYTLSAGTPEVMTILKDKFRIDIGSLLLGFTMVWAYATFCQYMLIWAANLPEELTYFKKRGEAGWEYLAYFLMAFHWLLPFVVLLFREVKTNPRAMKGMACLLLTVCAADVVWWIVPAIPHPEGGLHAVMGFAAIVGVGGLWGLYFLRELSKRPILPANSETKFLATWGQHH